MSTQQNIPLPIKSAINSLLQPYQMSFEDLIKNSEQAEHKTIYMTKKQAMEYTGFSAATLWRAVKAGNLRELKPNGRLRYIKSELDTWLQGENIS